MEFCISFFITKYSKFTGNIRSGIFTDTFCQKYQQFPKKCVCVCVCVCVMGEGGEEEALHSPHIPLGTPLQIRVTHGVIERRQIFSARKGPTFRKKELNSLAICSAEYNNFLVTFKSILLFLLL